MTGTITVQGSAVAAARPDRARLVLAIRHVAADRAAALAAVSAKAQAVESAIADLGIDPRHWVTAGITVDEEIEWRDTRRVRLGFAATTTVQVTVADAVVIARLATIAADVATADVTGPLWIVDDANPARRDARREAAAEARRRADDYAGALGLRLGEVLDIIEPGLAPRPPRPEGMRMMAASASAAADVPVHTGDLEVAATVQVTFALLAG